MISGETPQHEMAVLSRPAVQGSLLKFLLPLPHALSIRLAHPSVEAGPLLTSSDVQFANSIYLDIGKPQAKVVHQVVNINWARAPFLRSFSVVSIERKDKRRRVCAQAMASGAATGYAYTKISSCAGNRAVSLEMQALFSTDRFGFAEYCWSP